MKITCGTRKDIGGGKQQMIDGKPALQGYSGSDDSAESKLTIMGHTATVTTATATVNAKDEL